PIPRGLLVLGNLLVALAITALQVGVLIAVAVARGIGFDATAGGIAWFAAAGVLFTVGMYGAAEILANRVPRPQEDIARGPASALPRARRSDPRPGGARSPCRRAHSLDLRSASRAASRRPEAAPRLPAPSRRPARRGCAARFRSPPRR